MDRRLGYQVPRMWYPHARPETNSRQLSQPPPRADPLERAQRPHTSDLVRDEYYTQRAYSRYAALSEADGAHPLGAGIDAAQQAGRVFPWDRPEVLGDGPFEDQLIACHRPSVR